jgi:hypothetical protein
VQRGESRHVWKLSRRQKKGGVFIIFALLIALVAINSYTSGNVQLAQGLGVVAVVAFLLGLSD